MTSFPTILSMHGEIMHGYPSPRPLEDGRLMLCDAGAETNENYCSDNTRTTPINGRFTSRQRDITASWRLAMTTYWTSHAPV